VDRLRSRQSESNGSRDAAEFEAQVRLFRTPSVLTTAMEGGTVSSAANSANVTEPPAARAKVPTRPITPSTRIRAPLDLRDTSDAPLLRRLTRSVGSDAPRCGAPEPINRLLLDPQHLAVGRPGAEVGHVKRAVRPDDKTCRVAQPSLRVDGRARAVRCDADDRARPAEERQRGVLSATTHASVALVARFEGSRPRRIDLTRLGEYPRRQ
jgi:hypothetical protein